MRHRRLVHALTSDDEDSPPPPPPNDEKLGKRKRKLVHFHDDDDEELDEPTKFNTDRTNNNNNKKKKKKEEEPEPDSENDDQEDAEAQPLGEIVRVSGKGRGKRNHYDSFEYRGHQYRLEDPALFQPENEDQKPYVAIIKDIAQTLKGEMMVTGQWFYRPEEAEVRGRANWQSCDTRDLFYSFHRDEVPAESIFHKCVVHFVPLNKQIPRRQQHPGFIVQKVYDTEQRKLFKLTDKDYEESKQHEIDLLVQKTVARIGDLPDLPPEEPNADHEDHLKNKRLSKRKNISHLDVSREDKRLSRSQSLKAETPVITPASSSEYYAILLNLKMLTGETQRDKWLEKLLQSIQYICNPVGSKQNDGEEKGGSDVRSPSNKNSDSNIESQDKIPKGEVSYDWPDAVVPAVIALEKAAHDALSSDFQKYNQKMRQLAFNLKSNAALAQRFLNKELEPEQILNMSPNELKEGLTADEIASRKPEESGRLQMTDARCKRCTEKQVGLIDIIQTGHGDRYQLECVPCGNTWYASRDDAATLTIEGPTSAKTVGTAPLATAKFEDVEKSMLSPRGAEKGPTEEPKKIVVDINVPVLDEEESLDKTRTE